MSVASPIKPNHKAIKAYHQTLQEFRDQNVAHEGAVRSAFQSLLTVTGRQHGWTLIPELSSRAGENRIAFDGTFRDANSLPRGFWEAKDTADDLEAEIIKKTARGYSLVNSIFEDTRRAVLYQDKQRVFEADLTNLQQIADLLNQFYAHTEPAHDNFDKAVDEFKERVPDLARGLAAMIHQAYADNPKYKSAFDQFFDVCRTNLNPNLSQAAVEEMLVQHLLTERLIRKVFDNAEFTKRNVIAAEVEKVIAALVSKSFSREKFLKSLDRFYLAIEEAAHTLPDFSEKQRFLNTIYERFFQGYSVKTADTHGIVYTPQEIVDFMCASVVEVLKTEFGKSLGDNIPLMRFPGSLTFDKVAIQ